MSIKATDFVKFLKPGWWLFYRPSQSYWMGSKKPPKKISNDWCLQNLSCWNHFSGIDIDPPDNWETSLIQNPLLEHDFKVGERIIYYNGMLIKVGVIKKLFGDILIISIEKERHIDGVFEIFNKLDKGIAKVHYKQCRKLVLKAGVEVEEQ